MPLSQQDLDKPGSSQLCFLQHSTLHVLWLHLQCCLQQETPTHSCLFVSRTKGDGIGKGQLRRWWSHCPCRCLKDWTGTECSDQGGAGSQAGLEDSRALSNLNDSVILACLYPAAELITWMNLHTSIPRQFSWKEIYSTRAQEVQLCLVTSKAMPPFSLSHWVVVLESSKILLCKQLGKPRIQRG